MARQTRSSISSLEKSLRPWIGELVGDAAAASGPTPLAEWLRDGTVLCALANAVHPRAVRARVERSALPFKQLELIRQFVAACRRLGVAEGLLFEPPAYNPTKPCVQRDNHDLLLSPHSFEPDLLCGRTGTRDQTEHTANSGRTPCCP